MRLWRLISTVVAVAAFSAVIASQTPSGHAVFEQALAKERVEGNLPEAIRLYERVVAEFAADRALAAKALMQAGLCYEKLGREESVKAYERLLRDFADQADAVSQARARLAALKRSASGAAAPSAPVAAVRPLPRLDRDNDLQAVSPDGARALLITRDKSYNLAVHDFATGVSQRLTEFVRGLVWSPVWSRDGRRVAYVSGGLDLVSELRVTTLGGDSRLIFRNEANPGRAVRAADWLPSGHTLLAVLERADRTSAIGLISVDGGPFKPLRSLSWTGGPPDRPRVSPDGRFVAFADGPTEMRDIHVLSLDGRTAHRVTDHPADDRQPLWSPDGRHLVFTSTRFGSTALWAVAIKDGQPQGEPVRIKDGMQDVTLIDWTSRGLVYVHSLQTDDVYTMSVNRSTALPAGEPQQLPYARTGRNYGPIWSPDGRHLAFISGSPAEPDRRYVVLLPEGGGEPREFRIPGRTTTYSSQRTPYDLRWFGDSSGLGFSDIDPHGQPTLFHLTLATGQWRTYPIPVTTRTRIEWNADGSAYFYARGGRDPGIYEHDLKSDRERPIYKPSDKRGSFRGLTFGPDRRLLAFLLTSREGEPGTREAELGTRRVVVVNTETGETQTVMDEQIGGELQFWTPGWLPGGRALVVPWTDGLDTMPDLRVASLDGGGVRSIGFDTSFLRLAATAVRPRGPTIEHVVWSPDGTRMAFVLSAFRRDTWVMENPLAVAGAAAGARK